MMELYLVSPFFFPSVELLTFHLGRYCLEKSGRYLLYVKVNGKDIKDVPYTVKGVPGKMDPKNAVLKGYDQAAVGSVSSLQLYLYDSYMNPIKESNPDKLELAAVLKESTSGESWKCVVEKQITEERR